MGDSFSQQSCPAQQQESPRNHPSFSFPNQQCPALPSSRNHPGITHHFLFPISSALPCIALQQEALTEIQTILSTFLGITQESPMGDSWVIPSVTSLTEHSVVIKDLYQVQKTLKKLCEFSTVWADLADLGSQKLFSKLTLIFPRKTHKKISKFKILLFNDANKIGEHRKQELRCQICVLLKKCTF